MRITSRIAAMVAAIALVGSVAAPALAQTDPAPGERARQAQEGEVVPAPDASRLERAKAWLEAAIERRLEQIDRLEGRVRSSETLAPEHAGQLTSELARAQGGLRALLPEAARAQTLDEVRSIANEMVEEFRVYVLMTPKTLLTIASDHGVALAHRGAAHSAAIAEAARRAESAGHDVSEVWPLLARADEAIGSGLALIDPIAETVLPLQPADYPDPARVVLADAHADAVDARAAFEDAKSALGDAVATLREIVRGDRASVTS